MLASETLALWYANLRLVVLVGRDSVNPDRVEPMPRQPRALPSDCAFYITVRCNNIHPSRSKRLHANLGGVVFWKSGLNLVIDTSFANLKFSRVSGFRQSRQLPSCPMNLPPPNDEPVVFYTQTCGNEV
jgi:hypothetical protein